MTYPLAFMIGLFSALHCIGMCGGIVGAISYSLPREVRDHPTRYVIYLLVFNLGRISSYAVAGVLAGWLGLGLMSMRPIGWLDEMLRLLASAVLIGIGLYIGGWLPRFAVIERLGMPLWRHLEPLARSLLPISSFSGAFLTGAIWGWIPCGLVYSMLISVPAQGGGAAGALYMALFGCGSLPVVLATGLLAGKMNVWGRDRRFQGLSGLILVGLALLTLYEQAYNLFTEAP